MMSQICGYCLKYMDVVLNVWMMSHVGGCCLRSSRCCLKSTDTTEDTSQSSLFLILFQELFECEMISSL